MKRRWLVIAVVAAGAAFALVLLWPARPLWQANLGSHAYPLGFTADNRTLLAATGATSSVDPQLLDNPDGPPTLFRFDVATGRPLAEPQIVGPLNARGPVLVPSPDGQRLLVKGSTSGEAPSTHFLDLASGISRPLPRIGHSNTNHFSPDSRWFWVENLDPPTDHSLELRDGTTGEHVRRIPPPTPRRVADVRVRA